MLKNVSSPVALHCPLSIPPASLSVFGTLLISFAADTSNPQTLVAYKT